MPVSRCIYTTKTGKRCQGLGKGDPPLCGKHKRAYKPPPNPVLNDLLGALLNQPAAQRITKKLDEVLGKAAGVVDKMSGEDFSDLNDLLGKVGKPKVHYPPQEPAKEDPRVILGFKPGEPLTEEVIKDRRKQFAKVLHPDKGGSDEAMKRINEAVDALLEEIGKK